MPLPRSLPQSAKGATQLKEGRTGAVQVLARRYRVERKMGSGAFGTAFLVTDLKSRDERKVLKQIGVADLLPDETVDAVREARLLAKLDHPSIVKFHDSFLETDFFCIITEFCEGGDLDQKIRQLQETGQSLGEMLIVDWFIQLTTAIMYIHERRILHRDLKTRNIFLKNNLIKLGDFGISRILMGTSDLASTFAGTPHFMSPEALKQNGYNSKSDIWSLGVVLYELCTLRRAFPGSNIMAVMYRIVEGERPELPATVSSDLRRIFSKMLEKDPRKRPSAVAILQESFLQERMESLRGKLANQVVQAVPPSSPPSSSPSIPLREAEAIAKALKPVKKKNLQATSDSPPLTPRQQLARRKQEKADQEARERYRLAAENYCEGRKRFSEQKKKQARVVPPWVDQHPDVFSDPEFSLTQLGTGGSDSFTDSLEIDESNSRQEQQQQQKWLQVGKEEVQEEEEKEGEGEEEREEREEEKEEEEEEVEEGREDPEEAGIPDDPSLAETHYSQFDDFEEDEESSSSEDEYGALMECIEDALDLPNQPLPESPPVSPHDHDEFCPFSSQAREKKIEQLRLQCISIYGEEEFGRIYAYLKEARSHSIPNENEADVVSGLKLLTSNTRDCFLVDQLVFLEKRD